MLGKIPTKCTVLVLLSRVPNLPFQRALRATTVFPTIDVNDVRGFSACFSPPSPRSSSPSSVTPPCPTPKRTSAAPDSFSTGTNVNSAYLELTKAPSTQTNANPVQPVHTIRIAEPMASTSALTAQPALFSTSQVQLQKTIARSVPLARMPHLALRNASPARQERSFPTVGLCVPTPTPSPSAATASNATISIPTARSLGL